MRVPSPARVLAGLLEKSPYAFWLDSSLARRGERNFSVVGAPYAVFESRGASWTFFHLNGKTIREGKGNPWEAMERIFQAEAAKNRKTARGRFAGMAAGALGYGLKDFLEKYPRRAGRRVETPDACLMFVKDFWLWENGKMRAVGNPGLPPHAPLPSAPKGGEPRFFPTMTKARYLRAVRRIKEHIARGDVYQVNLTRRLDFTLPCPPLALYLAMRRVSPAPYGAYLAMGETHVASASPERFLKVNGRRAVSEPMKGTAPRGADPAQDRAFRRALARSEKNRAENLMICDLVRNDLGRVCVSGSVRVKRLFHVETYRTLHQMTSQVEGTLLPKRGAWDALRALFPPGSMTGAPKIRAATILDDVEPVGRGLYAGALGFMDFHGDAEWSVVIRTLIARGGRGHYHAGGGIVADSDAEAEFAEAELKAEALKKAFDG